MDPPRFSEENPAGTSDAVVGFGAGGSGSPAPHGRPLLCFPRIPPRTASVEHGLAAIDAWHGIWRQGYKGRLRASWLPFQFSRLVRGGLKLSARGGGNGAGSRRRESGGSRLPARRSVRQTPPDDAGVGRLPQRDFGACGQAIGLPALVDPLRGFSLGLPAGTIEHIEKPLSCTCPRCPMCAPRSARNTTFQRLKSASISFCDCPVRSPSITTWTERSSTTGCNMNGRFSGAVTA